MGMLIHHTWLEQQKAEEPKKKPVKEEIPFAEPAEEPEKKEPARKSATTTRRRKTVK